MPEIFPALYHSLKVALIATTVNLVLGTLAGYLLARKRFIGRELLDTILVLPMVLPPTVMGYYLLVVFGRNGIVINLIFTWQGAVIAAVVVTFPLITKPARAAFENIAPNLEKMATVFGASRRQIFFNVTLPLAWRGILAGVLLAFARALGEFGATLMVAGSIPNETQTLSIAVYEAVQAGDDALANKLVIIISLVCIAMLLSATALAKWKQRG